MGKPASQTAPGLRQEMLEVLRLARQGVDRHVLADALTRLAAARPGVARALYLAWQAGAGTYAELGSAERLPPGQGDPLSASDAPLQARLRECGALNIATLRQLPCWLAGRLRRSGIQHGLALELALTPDAPGLLLIVTPDAQGDLHGWVGELLGACLLLARQAVRPSPLLDADAEPALLLDDEGRLLDLNQAGHALRQACAVDDALALLPGSYRQMLAASLQQRRAVGPVMVEVGGRILLWQLVPELDGGRVVARGRDASEQIRNEREAAQARRLYRLIIENTTDLISRHTPDGCFLDASPASWTLLGYWPEQLHGRRLRELLHPDDLPRMREARDALEQRGYHTLSYRLRHRDGRLRWFETACRAIRDTYTGTVVEVVSVSRDVTARVQGEEIRRRLAEVIEATTDLVFFIDRSGRLTYLNQAARRTLGLPEDAAPELAVLMAAGDRQHLLGVGLARAEQCGAWESEMRLLADGGRASLPVSLVLLAHASADGAGYFSLVARDMTERELREAEARRHQDELAHTARLVTLGELASGIAHEINQPLAAVVNYASASQRYLQGAEHNPQALARVAQGLERITAHANHASSVIRRLRAFLRKGQRRMQALDVAAVAREAVRLCAWEAERDGVAVIEQLPDNLPAVLADRVLLEQVLLNLLRNAIEANREVHPQGGSQVLIAARLDSGGQQLAIRVEDQGPGVSEDELGRLFTPFYTSKAEGLGLGLSMSRSIIEGFGGELTAQRLSGGLRLLCCLPVAGGEQQ